MQYFWLNFPSVQISKLVAWRWLDRAKQVRVSNTHRVGKKEEGPEKRRESFRVLPDGITTSTYYTSLYKCLTSYSLNYTIYLVIRDSALTCNKEYNRQKLCFRVRIKKIKDKKLANDIISYQTGELGD